MNQFFAFHHDNLSFNLLNVILLSKLLIKKRKNNIEKFTNTSNCIPKQKNIQRKNIADFLVMVCSGRFGEELLLTKESCESLVKKNGDKFCFWKT